MREVPAAESARKFGLYREIAQREPVVVTSHGRPTGYFVSAVEFEAMQRFKAFAGRSRAVADLTQEEMEQMAAGRMDAEHDHLNALPGRSPSDCGCRSPSLGYGWSFPTPIHQIALISSFNKSRASSTDMEGGPVEVGLWDSRLRSCRKRCKLTFRCGTSPSTASNMLASESKDFGSRKRSPLRRVRTAMP